MSHVTEMDEMRATLSQLKEEEKEGAKKRDDMKKKSQERIASVHNERQELTASITQLQSDVNAATKEKEEVEDRAMKQKDATSKVALLLTEEKQKVEEGRGMLRDKRREEDTLREEVATLSQREEELRARV